jgi:hypothetical protein
LAKIQGAGADLIALRARRNDVSGVDRSRTD